MAAYDRTAHAYDLIHQARGHDYEAQALLLSRLIHAKCPEARTLLDVACGTGSHLSHLRSEFEVAGVDGSEAMLDRARLILPNVELVQGDMRDFQMGRTFDAVTCLFSSIGYLLTLEDVRAAAANMARHLNPGGVLILEPWFHPDQWFLGHRVADAANGDGLAVSRVSVNGRRGHISTFEFHWMIASESGIDAFVEKHEMGLYTVDEYVAALEAADLSVEHDPVGLIGRGLFIGTRR